MPACRPSRRRQPVAPGHNPGLEALVARFRNDHAQGLRNERDYFRTLPSIELVIHHVAMATDGCDRCFDHQFRILRVARPKAKARLTTSVADLKACRSFDALHSLLSRLLSPVRGLGELYIYDAAVRLGAYLGLAPDLIYLHAGTRAGALALGLGRGRPYLQKRELPRPMQILTADEIESFLCIYKAVL